MIEVGAYCWKIYRHKKGLTRRVTDGSVMTLDYYVEMENFEPREYYYYSEDNGPREAGLPHVRLKCVRNALFPDRDGDWSIWQAPEAGLISLEALNEHYAPLAWAD